MKPVNCMHTALALLLLFVSLCGCTPPTALRQHPNFDAGRKHIERVAVLPPTVKVERVMFTGDNETLADKEESYPDTLTTSAIGALNRLGYATSKVNLIEQCRSDTNLAFQVEQIKNAYEAASKPLVEASATEKDYKRFRATLGPVVNPVADAAAADALLLVQFEGMTKSEGEMKKEYAANILLAALTGAYADPIKSASFVHVALIDGTTGDILWVNTDGKAGLTTSVLTDAMDKLPEGGMQDVIAAEKAAAEQAARAAGLPPPDRPASWH